jgi:hypothetical protein
VPLEDTGTGSRLSTATPRASWPVDSCGRRQRLRTVRRQPVDRAVALVTRINSSIVLAEVFFFAALICERTVLI